MKKFLPILYIAIFLFVGVLASYAYQDPHIPAPAVTVSANIGEFDLNLFGFVSPYANIFLTTDNNFLRATVADQNGNFSLQNIPIKKGFSHFCLEAIDYKRLGSSTTCFSIPPAKQSVTMKDIFLPPTLGLQRATIAPGGEAIIFGYTMPFAKVELHLSDGEVLTGNADTNGYYLFTVSHLKPGNYSVYAKAFYKGKESLSASKRVEFTALSWWQQVLNFLIGLWNQFIHWLTNLLPWPLWLAIPLIILIIILLIKIFWPQILVPFSLIHLLWLIPYYRRKRLHHWWFVGF